MKETPLMQFDADVQARLRQAVEALGGSAPADGFALAACPNPQLGDAALPCFNLRGQLSQLEPKQANNPAAIAQALAAELGEDGLISACKATGPYLNITYGAPALAKAVIGAALEQGEGFGGDQVAAPEHIAIEFSAPNTNKPQHLGHVRNNVLGESVGRILAHYGDKLTKVNLVNDRGIHICKSMLAYQLWGEETTPEARGMKGDHLIGYFYVLFDQKLREEYGQWQASSSAAEELAKWHQGPDGQKLQKAHDFYQDYLERGDEALAPPPNAKGKKAKKRKAPKEPASFEEAFFAAFKDQYFNEYSELGAQAREMLRLWEQGEPATMALWRKLNAWVLAGFDETYTRLGIHFDKVYLESETYKLGKAAVERGLAQGIFSHRDDGAVVFDLSQIGESGEKVILRSDGTSVYMTQDLGTALARKDELDFDRMVYVVGDEQNYHFRVLFGILGKLRSELEGRCEHLSYGMVNLPHGRMKSREGTVVDADDLMQEMHRLAAEIIESRRQDNHYQDTPQEELDRRAEVIGLGSIKYFLLDISPQSSMEFDPEKSLDFQGRTGAYLMMNYARTRSLIRRAGGLPEFSLEALNRLGTDEEKRILLALAGWPAVVKWAAESRDPSRIAEYLFNLCKGFAFIFTDRAGHPIATCEDPELRNARLQLVEALGITLRTGLGLLGIETLEEM